MSSSKLFICPHFLCLHQVTLVPRATREIRAGGVSIHSRTSDSEDATRARVRNLASELVEKFDSAGKGQLRGARQGDVLALLRGEHAHLQ